MNIEANLRKLKNSLWKSMMPWVLNLRPELSDAKQNRLKFIHGEMKRIWLKEEIKAKQISRDIDILKEDIGTLHIFMQ